MANMAAVIVISPHVKQLTELLLTQILHFLVDKNVSESLVHEILENEGVKLLFSKNNYLRVD